MDRRAKCRSMLCAAQSVDCPNPRFAPNIFMQVYYRFQCVEFSVSFDGCTWQITCSYTANNLHAIIIVCQGNLPPHNYNNSDVSSSIESINMALHTGNAREW